jgi:hypothetical protein
MSVFCECCVLSRRGLCNELITRPEESYRLWCVWVWSWSVDNEEAQAHVGLSSHRKKMIICHSATRPLLLVSDIGLAVGKICRWTAIAKWLSIPQVPRSDNCILNFLKFSFDSLPQIYN